MRALERPPDGPSRHIENLEIHIHSDGACWFLECDSVFERLMFHSGRAAEAAGRTLAARLAVTGRKVHLAVEQRPGALAGPAIKASSDPTGWEERT